MKNKNIFFRIILLSILFSMLLSTFVYAESNIDLASGKIIGRNSKYYFEIPTSWENYIYVQRDYKSGNDYFDKINFYYKHIDINNSDVKYLTLYAYNISNYKGYKDQDVVLRTDKYVFTATENLINPYMSTNDRIIFSRFVKELQTPNFLANQIFVSTDTPSTTQNGTLSVNGKKTSKKPIIEKGEVYLPLRETSEKLGYTVIWIPNTKTILLQRSDKSVNVVLNSIKNKNVEGNIYLPIQFFMKNLGCNVDIDSRNNITITD